MAFSWNKLRTLNGSIENAFEELCCQLAADESPESSAKFFRKGTPDAGVECYWRLSNGDEWAWQAKWFLSSPDQSQWRQIDKSVKTALGAHPDLKKYMICLPINRPDSRKTGKKTCMQKWNEHVVKWEELAHKKGMTVSFEYWGESEIIRRLGNEKKRGRYWFWFNEEIFSKDWFIEHVEIAEANASDRYSPELNVDLPISRYFESLGRTPKFFGKISNLTSKVEVVIQKLLLPSHAELIERMDENLLSFADRLVSTLHGICRMDEGYEENKLTKPIPWNDVRTQVDQLEETLFKSIEKIDSMIDEENQKSEKRVQESRVYQVKSFRRNLDELSIALDRIQEFSNDDEACLSNKPALLLKGDAGQGKTHLLCHIAKTETLQSRFRILLHGEQFEQGDPWPQIIQHLGLNCTLDEFLGGLEAAAQASNSRILFFIDALNEGSGNVIWKKYLPGMLKKLSKRPWLGICLSIRNAYFDWIIHESLLSSELTVIEHHGFSSVSYEAALSFFNYFNIEPLTPLLLPEFNNPLFLKLYCKSIVNSGLSRLPSGLHGISGLFRFHIDSIDKKLSHQEFLDYSKYDQFVRKAINLLTDEMALNQRDYLPIEEARSLVDALLSHQGYSNSLFHHLSSEGIIRIDPNTWNRNDARPSELVRFTYQRFSDHMIAGRLLESYLDKNDVKESFVSNRPLGELFKDEGACWNNIGILEALVIQLPELVEEEFPFVIPHLTDTRAISQSFVKGIVWRNKQSFSSKTDQYIKEYILSEPGDYLFREFWNSIITLATIPDHPWNADRLTKILGNCNLAERDAWWSVFLHKEQDYEGDRSVYRMINWAWDESDKLTFNDEIIRLAGITLTWFLTTANRFIRDSATQALVRLCESRFEVLLSLLRTFKDVNDPYITERLLAVSYGCVLRTTDSDGIKKIALEIYDYYFNSRKLPQHLLSREYARCIVEKSIEVFPKLRIDKSKITPPYSSEWPGFEIPSEEKLMKLFKSLYEEGKIHRSLMVLEDSVMRHGDFSRYTLGKLRNFSSSAIGEKSKISHIKIYDEFLASLTPRQKDAWSKYRKVHADYEYLKKLSMDQRVKEFEMKVDCSDEVLEELVDYYEQKFISSLRRGSGKHNTYTDYVKDYAENPHDFYSEKQFDGDLARRWLMQRILDLGWTPRLFGSFDSNIDNVGREAGKAERIGKKYQWIAYYELLAILTDNFKLNYGVTHNSGEVYTSLDDIGVTRDIDTSNLLKRSHSSEGLQNWWFPLSFNEWNEPVVDDEWVAQTNNLPDVENIIQVVDSKNDVRWLTLDGYYEWYQPLVGSEDLSDIPRKNIWYMLKSYIVKTEDSEELYEWSLSKDWMGRWMPENHESYGIFLGEYFNSRYFKNQDDPYYNREGWTQGRGNEVPVKVLVSNDEYGREKGGYDCSLESNIYVNMPCKFLTEEMDLSWFGKEGSWFDRSGHRIAFDPSIEEKGPRALLMHQEATLKFLMDRGLTLFWTLLGEKRILGASLPTREFNPWLEVSGAYVWDGNQIKGNVRTSFKESKN